MIEPSIFFQNNPWNVKDSIISFPHLWQRPAKTEEWIYETLIKNKSYSKFVEYIAFPWATFSDLISRKKDDKVKKLHDCIQCAPVKKTLIRATACQHIDIEKLIPYFKRLKITDLFWAHKKKGIDRLFDIRIHPLALYPVAYFCNADLIPKNIEERSYLLSFMGTYDPNGYLSDIREKIFSLPHDPKIKIVKQKSWHFEHQVYDIQINDLNPDSKLIAEEEINMREYRNLMVDSIFTLCPSGSGPNSIRLWEALALGSIPIVLSDYLSLPKNIQENLLFKVSENNFEIIKDHNFLEQRKREINAVNHYIKPDCFIKNVTVDLFKNDFIQNARN